jgi:putative ABC transport system substrate-binding protein
MTRHELIFLLAAVLTLPRALRAQQKVMPVVGYLNWDDARSECFRVGRVSPGAQRDRLGRGTKPKHLHYDRLPALAADLVGQKVDLIVAVGGADEAFVAKDATSTIPIVFSTGADPVETGLVASLARPGGNRTGVTNLTQLLWQKRVELLAELVPQAKAIGLLLNPNNAQTGRIINSTQQAVNAKGLQLEILKAGTEAEINTAFATAVDRHIGAVIVGDPLFDSHSGQVAASAARHRVPAIYSWRKYVADGGLISYGAISTAAFYTVGVYAGRILNGAKPADLPVQQSTNFELVVNLDAAKALGLTVPPAILARADEVIE